MDIANITVDMLVRRMVGSMNHPNFRYEYTRLIAWVMNQVNNENYTQNERWGLAGRWNQANGQIQSIWFSKGFDTWATDVLEANPDAYKAAYHEMKVNSAFYEEGFV